VGTAPVFASADEALDMVRAGLGYLAAADATQLGAAAQARCLKVFEQADAIATAARASFLAAFTAGQGYCDDAAYSARAWLIHQTRVTAGAAVGHTAWARRCGTHPRVLAALAAGRVSASVGRQICLWTDKLPEDRRDTSDTFLLDAAAGGLGLEELAAMAGQLYERARSERPDEDPDAAFRDRGVKLATTFGGAGVLHGDLTAECAAIVGQVLDALGGKAGKEDGRSREERYHDALAEAMRRLVAANLLPERAGQPVKAWVHISLADLLLLDGDSALQEQWTRPRSCTATGPRPAPGRPPAYRGRRPDRSVPRDGQPGWDGTGSTDGCCPERGVIPLLAVLVACYAAFLCSACTGSACCSSRNCSRITLGPNGHVCSILAQMRNATTPRPVQASMILMADQPAPWKM
jgi:Domain of unknown function (DUF222)